MPDKNGYPTRDELLKIISWDKTIKSSSSSWGTDYATGVLYYIMEIWNNNMGTIKISGDSKIELHTGGWSGNEEIIEALQKTFFWYFYWQKSERGGHYYFETKNRP